MMDTLSSSYVGPSSSYVDSSSLQTPDTTSTSLPEDANQLQTFIIVVICIGAFTLLVLLAVATTMLIYCCIRTPQHHPSSEQQEDRAMGMTEQNTGTLLLPQSRVSKLMKKVHASTSGKRKRIREQVQRESLHSLLPKQRLQALEVSHSAVCIMAELSETNLGKVYKSEALGLCREEQPDSGSATVLVKSLREGAESDLHQLFSVEMVWASGFHHPNILTLLAVCTTEQPRYMVYEYLEFGLLDTFLSSTAAVWVDFESIADTDTSTNSQQQQLVGVDELLNISLQIADGMDYLARKGFVHKDIAARNCHVGAGLRVKIANFGLSYELKSADYCSIESKKSWPVSLRWLAPEALKHGQFSTHSDIWSYGVFLWEVFSLGSRPYAALGNAQVAQSILVHHVLQRPKHCPAEVYDVMVQCWNKMPQQRLTFSIIMERLKVMLAVALDQSTLSRRISLMSLNVPSTRSNTSRL